jgi:hypothetical protein
MVDEHLNTVLEWDLNGGKKCYILIFFILAGCDIKYVGYSTSNSYCHEYIYGVCVHTPLSEEHSPCTYYIDGICVIEDDAQIKIDIEILIWSFLITEGHVNTFYPNLSIFKLGKKECLTLHYKRASVNQYLGVYSDTEITAKVWIRSGRHITNRIGCLDRYEVAMHEILHFIDARHIYSEPNDHATPHLFKKWEILQPGTYEWNNTAEGLIYQDISNRCGY